MEHYDQWDSFCAELNRVRVHKIHIVTIISSINSNSVCSGPAAESVFPLVFFHLCVGHNQITAEVEWPSVLDLVLNMECYPGVKSSALSIWAGCMWQS